ncbi:sulfotransferase family protein [Shewanella frigidimarina]|uniref:sulfotransferase family protein n=1 Tax=Shewanella frigidimarina TaxID=56812 RepID=UPI000F4E48E5|nr:sulfotransferase family protein [Shewanella frigidimarina]RPA59641.1 sulfotransferase family protein [Shewanella frigidimarina]
MTSKQTELSTSAQADMPKPTMTSKQDNKVFIIGLPRTGTTSVSVALLEQGLTVAHQAFTKQAFMLADAVSDAPCFSDYQQLDKLFPNAKFVYLDRPLDKWLPSMQMLLGRMLVHLDKDKGRFHPVMKRSFNHCFDIWQVEDVFDEAHLTACYQRHQQQVLSYFAGRNDFITIDISVAGSFATLLQFIDLAEPDTAELPQLNFPQLNFPQLNMGRNVASWDEYKHPNKISANASGPDKRKFFDYRL